MKSIYERYGKEHKILTWVMLVAIIVLVISASINIPIYFRPFYYAHVDVLDLSGQTGYERSEIIEAYDEVLDYLTNPFEEFSTGAVPHSDDGEAHFADCRVLFIINNIAMLVSLVVVFVIAFLASIKVIRLVEYGGRSIGFYAGLVTLVLFGILAVFVLVDFQSAFYTFHAIFFPGKSNWLFDPAKDPIILMMPREFFMSCAVLICASIIITSVVLVCKYAKKREV